ncbi:MAG: ABC transporter permease [Bacteroidales bacterium]|nr:ABC transporter permease [Bacteroidales bacterium]MBD5230104.1 ABC transporter permease [Bacteroidales bacterium]MBD5248225.1 ABC transporter permease [Barnesiella sp.]
MNNILLVISREYTQRVRKKGFIFTTLLMPVVMLALMFAPALLDGIGSETEVITIVDKSGKVSPYLAANPSLPYSMTDLPADSLKLDTDVKTFVVIGEDIIENPAAVTLYHRGGSSMETEALIKSDIEDAIEAQRLEALQLGDLKKVMNEVEADVMISTQKIDDDGNESSSSSLTSYLIGIAMTFILYMFIIMYGQLVMMSIIEEKNNRVLEIIVTSIKPTHLMLGKIIGIGAVAVTQVVIWALLIAAFITFALPEIAGADLFAEVDALRAGTLDPATMKTDIGLLQVMALLSSLSYIFSIFGYLVLFLIGGFLLYASLYAAIGASVDNAQDGAQLQGFCIIPVILGLMFSITIGQNPDSSLATLLSMIPFTSPMVMMARIPSGVPAGEIVASLAILYASIVLIIWFTAKIYRVGIFMYGKKPTVKELIRWARYK